MPSGFGGGTADGAGIGSGVKFGSRAPAALSFTRRFEGEPLRVVKFPPTKRLLPSVASAFTGPATEVGGEGVQELSVGEAERGKVARARRPVPRPGPRRC